MSSITHGQLRSVADVLKVGETVKALVIKSTTPDRIALRYNISKLAITVVHAYYLSNAQ
jgi:predicted RNA-binding protein with RPS1 domain